MAKTAPKKVKVLCQVNKNIDKIGFTMNPQPLLTSSNSQKKVQMIKALQQINQNQMMFTQSQNMQNSNSMSTLMGANSPNSMSQINIKSTKSNQGLLNPQNNMLSFNSQSSSGPQNLLHSHITLVKSPKPLSQNFVNIPLSTKSLNGQKTSQNTKQKLKQIQKRASGILMQRCESQQSIMTNSASVGNLNLVNKQQQHYKMSQDGQFSPKQVQNKQASGPKHNRQNTIVNFNKIQQKSLSPTNNHQQQQQQHHVQQSQGFSNDRGKSLDNQSLAAIQRTLVNGSYDFQNSLEMDKRKTQIIKISPQKQFIVQPCTQHVSSKDSFPKNGNKLLLGYPRTLTNSHKNHILEQEEYLLPVSLTEDETILAGESQDYSLIKDFQTIIHHDYNMTKQYQQQTTGKQISKESDQSINQGFITDRQQSSKNELDIRQQTEGKIDNNRCKTKGISYTRNALELKKLLLETGVLGGMCMTASLATAAAGMVSSTQDTVHIKSHDLGRTEINPYKNGIGKVRNTEVFCFSARNKTNMQIVQQDNNQQHKQRCLLESKIKNKKSLNNKVHNHLESSVQTYLPSSNNLYQIPDQNINLPTLPQSTTYQQQKLRELILKDGEDSSRLYQGNRNTSPQGDQNNYQLTRRSPSEKLFYNDETPSSTNFPFHETDQFIVRKENSKKSLLKICQNTGSQKKPFKEQTHQRVMTRCWTAQDDIQLDSLQDESQSNNQNLTDENYLAFDDKTIRINNQQTQHSKSKIQCFQYYNKGNSPHKKQIASKKQNDQDNYKQLDIPQNVNVKELEILKIKMIKFVKTYENEFQKMKIKMNDLENENKNLKSKLNNVQKRRLSTNTQNSQTLNKENKNNYVIGDNHIQFYTSIQNSQMM